MLQLLLQGNSEYTPPIYYYVCYDTKVTYYFVGYYELFQWLTKKTEAAEAKFC